MFNYMCTTEAAIVEWNPAVYLTPDCRIHPELYLIICIYIPSSVLMQQVLIGSTSRKSVVAHKRDTLAQRTYWLVSINFHHYICFRCRLPNVHCEAQGHRHFAKQRLIVCPQESLLV